MHLPLVELNRVELRPDDRRAAPPPKYQQLHCGIERAGLVAATLPATSGFRDTTVPE